MKTMIKLLCSAAMVCGALSMSVITALAANEGTVPETTTIISTEKVTLEATKPVVEAATNVSTDSNNEDTDEETNTLPIGNGVLLEDKHDDVVDRQFLTIQSKNGNTFYIIVDKDSNGKENVYFMNLVDEYDLLAFADKFPEDAFGKNDKDKQPVVTDTNGKPVETVTTGTNGKPVEDKGNNMSDGSKNKLLFIIGILALCVGGAFYYFKFVKGKPKAPKQPEYTDDEDDEYPEETINEDNEE